MTKYSSVRPRSAPKPTGPHPIWRGIGCLTLIITPLVSYALAKLSVDYGLENGWAIPYQLLGTPRLPEFIYDYPVLTLIFGRLALWTNLYAYLAGTVLCMMVFGGLLSFGYAIVYAVMGPPRWGPLDAPPPRGVRPKSYKR
jgi:hypothetical protein